MAWLQQHANLISAFASGGMLLIWTIYAWLFYQGFRSQRSTQLFIHEAGEGNLQSICLLVNLSKEPVHVLCSLATRNDTTFIIQETHSQDLPPVHRTKQGPLHTGESMALGSFETISQQLDAMTDSGSSGEQAPGEQEEQVIEIRVAAIHGFRQWPVGARRQFRIKHRAKRVSPAMKTTEQMHSRRQAREVQRWVESCLWD